MVPIGMSQYDCPNERNCMVDNNNKRELTQKLP